MADADQIASAGTYLSKNAGVETTDGMQVRVTLGVITSNVDAGTGEVVPVDYGLKVVSSDGTTVIIDGNSDMFKIAASGTQSVAFPAAGNVNFANVILTALDVVDAPACMFLTTMGGGGAGRYPGLWTSISGTGTVNNLARSAVYNTAGHPEIELEARSVLINPGTTASHRYYVLVEAGI
jgi:hypothetical protein